MNIFNRFHLRRKFEAYLRFCNFANCFDCKFLVGTATATSLHLGKHLLIDKLSQERKTSCFYIFKQEELILQAKTA